MAKPFIGIVTTDAEVTPCTMGLRAQAAHAKAGIAGGGDAKISVGPATYT